MKKRFGYKNAYNGRLFLLCWIAYFSTYICRLNFSAVMPELLGSGAFTQSETAAVSSAFFICYGAGQLFSGVLCDKISARLLIFAGVLFSGLSNLFIFLFSESYTALLVLWALIIWMIFIFARSDRLAARLQIPYFLWVTFAAYLNLMIYLLNR